MNFYQLAWNFYLSRVCRNGGERIIFEPQYKDVDKAVLSLSRFYRSVDKAVARIVAKCAIDLRCAPGCVSCCMDGISVFWIEAENIRRKSGDVLSGLPHESGACAFLDKNGLCRIYDVRPYVCRTQGLALRWIDESFELEPVEMRDICPENDMGDALLKLLPSDCWKIGPYESILAGIQAELDRGALFRVALRSLFMG